MKIRELFENEEAQGKSLIGKVINGKKISLSTKDEEWDDAFECDSMGLTTLKYCPKKINGEFYCANNSNLESLEGMPQEGVTALVADECDLRSLKGIPVKINGDLSIVKNSNLTSLKGCSEEVSNFFASQCNLLSLEGFPKVKRDIDISLNQNLTSLKGMNLETVENLFLNGCRLTSLEGIPRNIKHLIIDDNPIKSLKGIHKLIDSIDDELILPNSIESNVLGLLKIKKLRKVFLGFSDTTEDIKQVVEIINKYLPNPTSAQIIDCQNELIEAGFEEYAEL